MSLKEKIPPNHVMLLYWIRTANDTRDTASMTGWRIIPSKGCIKAAEELDFHGERTPTEVIPSGHGVTILWGSGKTRNINT